MPEIRQQILDGHLPHEVLMNEKVGEIKAQIIERDGKILMVKDCPTHGHFEDVMSIDTEFSKHLEEVFPGRDIMAHNDEKLHHHGSSTVKYGRGSVLTIDLTNRCNMMCDPCFMDANQVGFVHELTWEEIKTMLDNAITIKPRRQMSVQFSGGEPTFRRTSSMRFAMRARWDTTACRPRPTGSSLRRALNSASRRLKPACAMPICSLTASATQPIRIAPVGNLFDVKLKAIENLHKAGCEIVPVITIVNGINNEQVGRIIQVRARQSEEDRLPELPAGVVHGPRRSHHRRSPHRAALHAGAPGARREESDRHGRACARLVPDQLHVDVQRLGRSDALRRCQNDWGQLSCGCHPNCGTGMAVMIDKETKEAVPVTAFLKGDQLGKDIAKVNDAARSKFWTIVGMALVLMKNYDPFQSPTHFKMTDLLKKFDKNFNATGKNYGKVGPDRTIDDVMKRRQDRWNFLFIAGMWFQDLFNYDFRRTEQCIIPYATQEGEISFCAYNTGVGWRNIIEKMHMTATLTKWYEEHGRHEIFAGGKKVNMEDKEHALYLREEIVTNEVQHDLDKLGIAKTAREEKTRARDAKLAATNSEKRGAEKNDAAYDARMAQLYREVVLKEKPATSNEAGFIPLGAIAPVP